MQTYGYRKSYPSPWNKGQVNPTPAKLPTHPEALRIAKAVAWHRADIGSKMYKDHYADVYASPEFQCYDHTFISDAAECFNETKAGKNLIARFGNWNASPGAEQSASGVRGEAQATPRPLTVGTDCSGMEVPIMALRNMGIQYDHVFSSDNDPHVKKFINTILDWSKAQADKFIAFTSWF